MGGLYGLGVPGQRLSGWVRQTNSRTAREMMDWQERFTKWPLPYDYTDARSIESYGKKLLESALRDHVPPEHELNKKAKGEFGVLLEKYYFFKIPDSRSEPDFPEAGVELKSTPI